MSEVAVNGKPTFKPKGNPDVKLTENQQQIDIDAEEFKQELKAQREELKSEHKQKEVEATKGESPLSHNLEVELIDKPSTFTLTSIELAKIIRAAQGGETNPHLVPTLPEDASLIDRIQHTTDDVLAEVGRGAHRMADGCRDIIGGAIDIITLGRAHRK